MDRPISFEKAPEDLAGVTAALQEEIDQAEHLVKDLTGRQFNGKREKALVYCLRHALELAKASLLCVTSSLPNALALLSRALLESLFWTRYLSLSDENAEAFEQSAHEDLKRIARKNLRAGFARIVDENTHDDKTNEFLKSDPMNVIQRRLRIEEVAEAGGLGRLYSMLYGFDSIYSHGTAFGLDEDADAGPQLYTSALSSLGYLQCINLMSTDWIKQRTVTPSSTISQSLGIPVDAP